MNQYRVDFKLADYEHFITEVSGVDVAEAVFIATLNLVHAVNVKGEVSLPDSRWLTEQALAMFVSTIQVEEL